MIYPPNPVDILANLVDLPTKPVDILANLVDLPTKPVDMLTNLVDVLGQSTSFRWNSLKSQQEFEDYDSKTKKKTHKIVGSPLVLFTF
ncbi:hypothetical protein CN692_07985 [Bacillus sp. AFS002410]|uniref:hypothetical protein n=1 Tax=Bacillus sp. AFS002410 TaxID=2033481 RepID=UPI000BF11503|nr:hypothetical protein [Bacillus sp. AFS002410]PEJ58214.1 hypothetical protein CN692_07985 [Bacillus sp. AFS002410]